MPANESQTTEIESRAADAHEALGDRKAAMIGAMRGTIVELGPACQYYTEGERVVAEPGDLAWPGRPLFTVHDPGTLRLEAAVARDRVVVVKKTDRRIIALGAAAGFDVESGKRTSIRRPFGLAMYGMRIDAERLRAEYARMVGASKPGTRRL